MARRRRFGYVRKLPSGRFQASYLDPDAVRRAAPETFATKRDAERWLSVVETELLRGEWRDPDRQREPLASFGKRWIEERPNLRVRTIDLYRWQFGKHIEPQLGKVAIGDLDPARIRRWRADLLAAGVSASSVAKAYRLLRAILMTAVDDDVLARNPCRIRGAQNEETPERPVLSAPQVLQLAQAVPARFSAMVLVAAFGSLRWGEAAALRRRDVDLDTGCVYVRRSLSERSTGEIVEGPPKSRAGARAVALPRPVLVALADHLATFSDTDLDALVFTGDKGGPLRRSNYNKQAHWAESLAVIGVPGLHFHDLRHTGNHLAAQTGASLRDLMRRMGHDSMRAALIYQHASDTGDRRIADALDAVVEAAQDLQPSEPSGGQDAAATTPDA